ncbi:hypothetical protein CN692_11830 [Bacillus sp. AFS002410]|uniref:hypothetical protein n=1 Tax=Bacillus sp. AFS002410 TaxID=2033481 RepID=UPI000BF1AE4F|nr:hypothetical protein [Bacillus sp. AFS002410]PEJ57771.1 hypothetical protein CN692_11830 [Bacillus sp. AFS002410]
MGLFINKNEHPDVFKNNEKIQIANQGLVRHNYLAELMEEQQKNNMNLEKSISDLKPHYEQLEELQTNQWNHVINQINSLIVSNHEREKFDSAMIQRLQILDANESLEKQTLIDQMISLNKAYTDLTKRLEKSESDNQTLSLQLNQLIEKQNEVAHSLLQQEEFQHGVLDRLDTQEALLERVSHQLNNIRSIIFERASYLTTKIEDSYKLTSDYIYKLIKGSEKNKTYTTSVNNKKEEKEKQKQSD